MYGLAVGHARKGHRVEHAEGMERVALVRHARDGGVEEVEVEVRVVADQDRALAFVLAHRRAHRREYVVQRLALGLGHAKGMVQDDAGDFRSEEHTSELQSLMRISY